MLDLEKDLACKVLIFKCEVWSLNNSLEENALVIQQNEGFWCKLLWRNSLVQHALGNAAKNSPYHARSLAKTSDKNSSTDRKGNALTVLKLKSRKRQQLMTRTVVTGPFGVGIWKGLGRWRVTRR